VAAKSDIALHIYHPKVWSIMARFIAADQAKADELSELITTETTLSLDDFVKFFNSGLINRKNEQVDYLSRELTVVYKDIVKKGHALSFITEEEIALSELHELTDLWLTFVRVKSVLLEAIAEGKTSEDARIEVSAGAIRDLSSHDNSNVELSTERIVRTPEDATALHARFSSQPEAPIYLVSDFTQQDESFVLQARELFA
jgi:hypothetical protein